MKRCLFALLTLLLVQGVSNAQNLFFDSSLPSKGFGLRATAFQPIDPMLDAGMTIRLHRYELDAVDPAQGEDPTTLVYEASIGVGLKFYAWRDASGNNSLYINPNAELTSFGSDEGLDMSINFGYTKRLTESLGLNLEVGARGKVMGYAAPLAITNRFQTYVGAGLSFNLANIFSAAGAGDPILTQ